MVSYEHGIIESAINLCYFSCLCAYFKTYHMKEDLNSLIKEAMLSRDSVRLSAIKQIKAEFVNFEKTGKELTPEIEIKLLIKLAKQHEDSISQFKAAGRNELAKVEEDELDVLNTFIPTMPTDEELRLEINEWLDKTEETITMRLNPTVIKEISEKHPGVPGIGKLVSEEIRKRI